MKQLRAAVIGLGVGAQHMDGYDAHHACRTVAICDLDAKKLSAVAAGRPHLRTTTVPEEILNDPSIDVVSIASPDDCHHRHVMAALRSGKHVFVEKPLCLLPDEAADIAAQLMACDGLRLGCNLILRRSPRFDGLREMIRAGKLGDVYQIEGAYNYGRLEKITHGWRGAIPYYSVTLGGGIHLLDLMMWMLGSRVSEVAAVGSRIAGAGTRVQFDDAVTATLRFENGAIGTLSSNFGCVYPHFHRFIAYGTKATFENRPDAGLLFTSRDAAVPPERIETPYPGIHKSALIGNFVDTILGRAAPLVTHREIFDCLAVCFAIEQALRNRVPAAVHYDLAPGAIPRSSGLRSNAL
jgi:predicted dehydrogenase